MSDHENTVAARAGRTIKWLAGACAMAGLLVAATGAWRVGAIVLGAAVTLFGAGALLEGKGDRAISFVILAVGILSMLGAAGHLLAGL